MTERDRGTLIRKTGYFCAIAALLFGGHTKKALANEAASAFYKGKEIELVVSTSSGGGYDTYARLVAEFMPNYIPGHPTIVVENMPGASGLKATNYIFNIAPRDGTVIATTHSSIPTAELLSPVGVHFDVNKLSWIGSVTKDPFVGYVWYTSRIQSLQDAKAETSVMAGAAVGAAATDYAIVAKELFGFKFRIVNGYETSGAMNLSMERGETDGSFANSWGSLKHLNANWLRDRKIRVIVQHGFEKAPDLPNVPLFTDQAKNQSDRQVLELMLARQEFSKPYFGPPGIPAARLSILRNAFDATTKDPAFIAAAKRAGLDVDDPLTGDEMASWVRKLSRTPSAVVRRINDAFADFAAGK